MAVLVIISMAVIFYIGVQPPNEWALEITVGFLVLTAIVGSHSKTAGSWARRSVTRLPSARPISLRQRLRRRSLTRLAMIAPSRGRRGGPLFSNGYEMSSTYTFDDLKMDVAAGRIDTVIGAQVDMQGR